MAKKYCPSCGQESKIATANFCVHCGQSLNTLTLTPKVAKASRQLEDIEDGSDILEVPELDGLDVSISGDDDDEKYVNTLTSFSFTANGGTVFVKPKKVKPRHI